MGGSRRTEKDRARVAHTINDPAIVVEEVEKRRCLASVEAYNLQIECWKETVPCPSVGIARIAGFPFMEVWCGGCRTVASIDLSRLFVHPRTLLTSVVDRLRCTRCRGQGPKPKIRGLRQSGPGGIVDSAHKKEPVWIEERYRNHGKTPR